MSRSDSPDALLAHAAFLRSLARHLLRDPSDADDAVQSTWRASLEHPPQRPHAVQAWLSKVLRNTIREDLRGRGRRANRERRAARPVSTESTADTAARAEVADRMVTAVRALPEPYRTTILLRYYEDLAPRRIAERMDAPVETVKSRLKRGRAQLRQSLEARGPDWRLALCPLAGIGPVASTGLTSPLGVAAMSTKVKFAAAGLLLALVGTLGWYTLKPPATEVSEPRGETPSAGADAVEPEPQLQGPTLVAGGDARRPGTARTNDPTVRPDRSAGAAVDTAQPSAARPPALGEARTVPGIVTIAGVPAAGGSIRVRHHGPRAAGEESVEEVSIERDGTFRIARARDRGLALTVKVEGLQPRHLSLRGSDRSDSPVEVAFGTGSIWGIAHDELGRPAEGAHINLSTYLAEGPEGYEPTAEGDVFRVHATTGLDGRYEFRDLPTGTFVLVGQLAADAANKARDMRSFEVSLEAGETRRLDLGGPHEDPEWSGVVRFADGTLFEQTGNMFIESENGERRMYVQFDKQGRFSEQVPIGTYRLEFVLPLAGGMSIGMRLVQTDEKIVVGYHGLVQDPTFPGARVSGRLSGRLAKRSQTLVFQRQKAAGPIPDSLISKNVKDVAAAVVQADGTYVHGGLWPGTYTVTAQPGTLRGDGGIVTFEVAAGRDEIKLDLELTP